MSDCKDGQCKSTTYIPQWKETAFDESIFTDFIKRQQIAIDQLTQQQIGEALRQAIKCGDFVKYVRQRDGAQQIIYIPFEREQELLNKIADLEKELAALKGQIR